MNVSKMNVSNLMLVLLAFALSACSLNGAHQSIGQSTEALPVQLADAGAQGNLILNDIWALERMAGEVIVLGSSQRPQLEIHLREMTLNGHDGCNNFFGSIEFIDDQSISFGPIGSTRMYCQPMDIPDRFINHFNRITGYELNGLTLKFMDAEGKELLQFRKID